MDHKLPGFLQRQAMEFRGTVVKCESCALRSTKLTNDCPGNPPHRLWVLMFGEDLCDYVDGEWVDWQGRPVDDPQVLRVRADRFIKNRAALYDKSSRTEHLRDKMAMEDTLMEDNRYNHLNDDPEDLFGR